MQSPKIALRIGASVCIPGEFHTVGWVSGELGCVSHVDLTTTTVKLQPWPVKCLCSSLLVASPVFTN